jgi:uncharacterized membrane protein
LKRWISPLLVVVSVIASVVAYPSMAERVPTHWNMQGEVDGWSSRYVVAWVIPLVMASMLVIFRILPHIDPRRANYEKFRGAYDAIVIATVVFMTGLHMLLLASATGSEVPIGRIIPAAVGAFFMVLGVLLPRAHPNWFIGIRTPWTMTSDVAWERTHRLGGTLFLLSGVLTVLASVATPRQAAWVLIVSASVTGVTVIAYSYVVWRQEKNAVGT